MKDNPFQDWVEKTAKYSGVLACGVRLANHSTAVKSFDESFPEARLGELLQSLAEVAFTLRNSQLNSSHLRWVFEHAQLYTARRLDGALAVLAMNKDPNTASVMEELFSEFLNMDTAEPETPEASPPEATEPGAALDAGGVQ
ncbi:MAG TPA: hypothetical protein VGR14_15775 [Verrucomicrobiae bacterium]|jgi:hypothetical protein|nr:hypothetical protein [Verrucomicrobiae bacterium]